MEEYELLVHVIAPAQAQHDNQYLAIARSTLDFQPVTVTRIHATAEQWLYMDSSVACNQNVNDDDHCQVDQDIQRPPSSSVNVSSAMQTDVDPIASSGFIVKSFSHQGAHRHPQTPFQDIRPRTVPDQIQRTVQVPYTGNLKRQAQSLSSSFNNSAATTPHSPDTAAFTVSNNRRQRRPTSRQSSPLSNEDDTRIVTDSFNQSSFEDRPPAKRSRHDSNERQYSDSSGQGQRDDQVFVCPNPHFLRQRSQDWTTSGSSSDTEMPSIPSTVTMSEPNTSPLPPIANLSGTAGRIVLDSASASHHGAASATPLCRSLPSPDRYGGEVSAIEMPLATSSSLFGSLVPSEASSPEPPLGSGQFISHVTPSLEDFARNLSFKRFFRPSYVKRDIQVLERGYWIFDVTVADAEVVEASRRSPTKAEKAKAFNVRFAGITHADRMAKLQAAKEAGKHHDDVSGFEEKAMGMWTASEVLTFWADVSRYIREGKAGWGIKMVRECVDVDTGPSQRVKLRIRLLSWGELVGHLYLAMWVLSNKLISRIPLQWIAGNGEVIVKMAGTRTGRGSLGTWTRKGAEGEGGLWGVAAEEFGHDP